MILLFLLSWFLVSGILYVVSETAQRYLYDQTSDWLIARSVVGGAPLAALLMKFPCNVYDMFMSGILITILHCVSWFFVFWFVLRFQLAHAMFVGVVSFLLTFWTVSLLSDSMTKKELPKKTSTLKDPAAEAEKKRKEKELKDLDRKEQEKARKEEEFKAKQKNTPQG